MISGIDAVAFDIDGTLYPNSALYRRMIPFFLTNVRFMLAFGEVRREIRRWQEAHPGEPHEDFFTWQASLMAGRLGGPVEAMKTTIRERIYEGWQPVFAKVRPFPHIHTCFTAFRDAGLKLGILSDFLPSQKGSVWGVAPLCDVVMGSEETGALKPSPVPFLALADALGVSPDRMLYVGNSVSSDVQGASAVGMKTACVVHPLALAAGYRIPGADISFSSYRKLTRNVLK